MDNLLFHAALHGIGGRRARDLATAALADVELADRVRDKARLLSGGQMRRVEIARALLHGPRMLVLDEPTVGLDIASKLTIVRHVRTLVRERGVAVLWTTHLFDEVEPTDNLVILHKGKRLAAGRVADVVAETGTDTLRAAFAKLTSEDAG
jgi:ABC-2 type transport system ATP-binding protein